MEARAAIDRGWSLLAHQSIFMVEFSAALTRIFAGVMPPRRSWTIRFQTFFFVVTNHWCMVNACF